MRLRTILGSLLVVAGLLVGTFAQAQNPQLVRLAVPDPIGSSVGLTAQHFATLVSERTGGAVTVEVFADGVLFGGDQNAAVNMLQNGTLDALILSTSVYASFEPRMNAISLPYLFSDYDEFTAFLAGAPGQTLLASLERLDTVGLALMLRTFRHVTNSVRPIETPADLQGLKLRVPNNRLWVEFFGPLGANPTPMNFTEVYTALQLKTIDGQENPVEVPLANKFFEVQRYLSLTGHIADAFVLGFNAEFFARFDAATQEVLRQAALDAAEWKREFDLGEADRMVAELEAAGMQVNALTAEQVALFQEAAKALYPNFTDLIGAEFIEESLAFLGRD